MDSKAFNECLDSGKFAQVVQSETTAGQQIGVQSTPTFIVNGQPIVGSQPFGGEGLSGTGPKAGGPWYLHRFVSEANMQFSSIKEQAVDTAALQKLVSSIAGTTSTQANSDLEKLQRLASSEGLTHDVKSIVDIHTMPGPTGETNQLSAHPRGLVLCLGPTRADALLQAISALAQQNSVVIVAEQAAQIGELLHQAGMSAAGIDGSVEPDSLRTITGVDAIMSQVDVEQLRAYRIALAERDGKLIPLISELDELDRRIIQMKIEREALLKESDKASKNRLEKLEQDLANLEEKGIFNERINAIRKQGVDALQKAKAALKDRKYAIFSEQAAKSWALATRVYDDVEKTQKDVLLGVLFYIALFVPFAFCMERLLFCYANIYKRIIAFCGILCVLIAVIYNVHPAFQLAYSPMVVVLAFFIIGLSLMVSLIIFFRFEEEMALLQRKARHMKAEEISRWKAFVSAFFLGVSNLRRHRLRTALTCATLIILTFTIMSFTSVKSMRHHSKLLFSENAPYQGLLLKKVNWGNFPPQALTVFENSFQGIGLIAPRIWLENDDRTKSTVIPLATASAKSSARGLIGLSADEPAVTGMDSVLIAGAWFSRTDEKAVLLPDRIAEHLGIDLDAPDKQIVLIWGEPHTVKGVFSSDKLRKYTDLDGEFLSPVIFPSEALMEVTEVEMEAMESGEDIRFFQSRYQHVPAELTLIIPAGTLLSRGGNLKSVAVKPAQSALVGDIAQNFGDRFSITTFAGERGGTYLYNASDAISYSGVPNIMIPLLISIFIVLNTMIGSVYERKREIGIYTSVGLAPSHVSFLFIAEALAFAVISVVLGYLLSQTSAKLFADTAL